MRAILVDTLPAYLRMECELGLRRNISLDSETTMLDVHCDEFSVVGISLAGDTQTGYYIPVAHRSPPGQEATLPKQLPMSWVLARLQRFLEGRSTSGANHKFDIQALGKHGVTLGTTNLDILLAAPVYDSRDVMISLDQLVFARLGYKPEKIQELCAHVTPKGQSKVPELRKRLGFEFLTPEEALDYAASDAVDVMRLRKWYTPRLLAEDDLMVVLGLEMCLLPVLTRMEQVGFKLDEAKIRELYTLSEKKEQGALAQMRKIAGNLDLNPRSGAQMGQILYHDMGIPHPKGKTLFAAGKTPPKGWMDKEVIEQIIASVKTAPRKVYGGWSKAEAVAFLTAKQLYGKASKFKTTYTTNLLDLVADDGRLHTSMKQCIASGRLASSRPNLMNIPRADDPLVSDLDIRAAFVADPGWTFVKCVHEDGRILTSRGQFPIKHVNVGDKVLSKMGTYCAVSRKDNNGEAECWRVTTDLGYSTVVTPEHMMAYVSSAGKIAYKQLATFQVGEWAVLPHALSMPESTGILPEIKGTHHNDKAVPDWAWSKHAGAYLRGLFEADGSMSSKALSATFSTITETLARDVQRLLLYMGIPASICRKKSSYASKKHPDREYWAWSVTVRGSIAMSKFATLVGFESARKNGLLNTQLKKHRYKDMRDFVPVPYTQMQLAWRQLHGDEREKVYRLIKNFGSLTRDRRLTRTMAIRLQREHKQFAKKAGITRLLEAPCFFDRVVSIEPVGVHRVYDIKVPVARAFSCDGFLVHNCDYAAQEMRIMAALSGDPTLTAIFTGQKLDDRGDKIDVHAYVGSLAFEEPYLDIVDAVRKKDKDGYASLTTREKHLVKVRQDSKPVNFGIGYGISRVGLAAQIGCSEAKSQKLITTWRTKAFTRCAAWLDSQQSYLREHLYTVTALGRRRRAGENIRHLSPRKFELLAKAYQNHPIQGTAGDQAKQAMIDVDRALREKFGDDNARMVLMIHDEIMVMCREAIAKEVAAVVVEEMTTELRGVDFPVDAEISRTMSKKE